MSNIANLSLKGEVLPSLKTAYDYFNKTILLIGRTNLDLFLGDTLSITGSSSLLHNTILTKVCVSSLLPKRHGGFGTSSSIFILDAGNNTDVYQHIEFMRRLGLNINNTLNRIIVSRVFTIYQLTDFIVDEMPSLIQKHNINLVAIPDLLQMFFQDASLDIREAEYLLKAIEGVLRKISLTNDILLLSSVTFNNRYPMVEPAQRILFKIFNKLIEITKNKTNNRLTVKIFEKQKYTDYITIKKQCVLSIEELLAIHDC